MNAFRLALMLLAVPFAVFGLTQIVIPAFRGRPMFPWFRDTRVPELQSKLEEVREDVDEAFLEREIKQTETWLERLKDQK